MATILLGVVLVGLGYLTKGSDKEIPLSKQLLGMGIL
jgi:hypothetical protein